MLGIVWIFCTWSALTWIAGWLIAFAGFDDAALVAAAAVLVTLVVLAYGHREAMRVPRVRQVNVTVPRLGAGLDGTRVVLITDTHYGPINRAQWSAGVVDAVNSLDPDIVCHTGDIADGTVAQRFAQSRHLGNVRARLARTYVTGNHEYYDEADGWLTHMAELGWEALHNKHIVVRRGGSELVVAGVDDRTAHTWSSLGHGADHATALDGAPNDAPVLLLAHQPQQITAAAAHGIDLQLSGHTHGGQIWPFHALVRFDQPALAGLSQHGGRTQLYTSRGTGFWGPPFRVFAPSEITLLILHGARV
jgi:predicted MPP superfamily phosphohydrolase